MLATCVLLRIRSRRLVSPPDFARSTLILRHVQHAWSSRGATEAPAASSTVTARLKPNNSLQGQTTNTSTIASSSRCREEGNQPGIESAVRGLKLGDGPDPLATTSTNVSRGFPPDVEGAETSIKHTPRNSRASSVLGEDLQAGPVQSNKDEIKTSTQKSRSEQPLFNGLSLRHGALNHEEAAPQNGSSNDHLRNLDRTGREQWRDWTRFGARQNRNDEQLWTVQTENGRSKAVHKLGVRPRRSSGITEAKADDGQAEPCDPHPKDSLFAHLRNPKGTRTDPGLNSHQKSSAQDRKPKSEAAREKSKASAFYQVIRAASVEEIEARLHHTAHHNPNLRGIHFMLRELIEFRHIRPQARHYEALILANCSPTHGTSTSLALILSEMQVEKIGIGPSTLSAALKLLSIHPSIHLLPSILQTLSLQWTTPTVSDQTHLILSLTRLNQFELALTHLESLINTSPPPNNALQSPIPQYLYTTLLYRLSSPAVADHTATLSLLYTLTDYNLPLSSTCMSYILDAAAEALHLELTLYLWRSHIDTGYIIPSSGLCRNALLTAARSGNAELARKSARVLEGRGNMDGGHGLKVEELELVREAFLGSIDKGREEEVGRGGGRAAVMRLQRRIWEVRRGGSKRGGKCVESEGFREANK